MPPRSGQLDQISEAIGEVRAYVHEGRHGINNLAQKVDALRVGIGKDIAAVEARMEVRFEAFEKRLRAIEDDGVKTETQKRTIGTILQSPIVGGIIGSVLTWAALFFAWWRAR